MAAKPSGRPWARQTVPPEQMRCDGCQLGPGQYDDDDGDGLRICPDCGYAVCDDCHCHACTYGMGGGGRPCPGVGICECGSCLSELRRQMEPAKPHSWNCAVLPALGEDRPTAGDLRLHHNLARGSCRCEDSNFGVPYADICRYGRVPCYMGGRGGRPFRGPVKPGAQKELESKLMRRDVPSLPVAERKCYNPGCDTPASRRCSRCRSVWYCSKDCQAAHFRHSDGPHKRECGKHYPPSEWKVASPDAQAYREKHGHYPGEVVWDGVPRLTALAMGALREADHPLVSGRECATAEELSAKVAMMGTDDEA